MVPHCQQPNVFAAASNHPHGNAERENPEKRPPVKDYKPETDDKADKPRCPPRCQSTRAKSERYFPDESLYHSNCCAPLDTPRCTISKE